MAYAHVTAVASAGDTSGSSTTVASAAFALAAGNLVVFSVTAGTNVNPSVAPTDTAGNTYTELVSARIADTPNSQFIWTYCCVNCLANAANVVTVTWAAAKTNRGILGGQYSGISTAVVDQQIGQLQATPGTGADGLKSTTKTPSAQPALLWGLSMNTGSLNNTPTTGTGFNVRGTGILLGAGSDQARYEDKRLTSLAAVEATLTAVVNNSHITVMAIFAEASSGGMFPLTDRNIRTFYGVPQNLEFANNPAQPYQQRTQMRSVPWASPAAVSPDVTVALTGALATFAAGALTPSTDVPLIGQRATFTPGTLIPSTSIALTGQAATFSAGSMLAALDKALVGQAANFAAGTLIPATTIALTGISATFTAGTVSVQGDVTVALTGVQAVFSAGQLVASSPIVLDQPSGGWGFYIAYEQELRRREKMRRKRLEDEEEALKAQDAISREIAQLLHEQERKDAERADLARLKALVAQYRASDLTDLAPRVIAAYTRALVQENFSALEALDRELRRQMEEEEMAVMLLLLADD